MAMEVAAGPGLPSITGDYLCPILLFANEGTIKQTKPKWRFSYMNLIFLIEQGIGFIEDDQGVKGVKPGSLLYIPAGKWHLFTQDMDKPLLFRYVFFDWYYTPRPEFEKRRIDYFHVHGKYKIDPYISPQPLLRINQHNTVPQLQPWLLKINPFMRYDIFQPAQMDKQVRMQGEFQLFLSQFLQLAASSEPLTDPRMSRIIAQMEKSTGEPHRLEEWVEMAGLSHKHFNTLFMKQTGASPKKYWNSLRIEATKEDLKNSTLSITEIAQKYHFSSVHHYSKLFRIVTGTTPSTYRQGHHF
jgi:AraC-like DNA-binding protein